VVLSLEDHLLKKIALFEEDGIEYRHDELGYLTGRQTFLMLDLLLRAAKHSFCPSPQSVYRRIGEF